MLAAIRAARGIQSDLPPHAVGPEFYTSCQNMVFRPFAKRASGYQAVYATPQTEVRSLLNGSIAGTNYWIYHGKANSYAVTSGTHTDVTHASGLTTHADSNRYTVGLFNGLPFMNNGMDPPQYWDGNPANNFVTLPGWFANTQAYSMREFLNFLVAINITAAGVPYGNEVRWSSAAPAGSMPGAWTAAATNEAGSAFCADTPGVLIDGRALGSGFVLYKQRSAYVMEYLERSSFVFSVRRLPVGRGVLTRNCIADFKGRHFLLTGDGDMVLTDGVSAESVADSRVRALLFNQLEQANYTRCFVVAYPRRNEIWVCFPTAGNSFCDHALIWNTQHDTWGERHLPGVTCGATGIVNDVAAAEAWDSDSQAWDADPTLWNEQGLTSAEENLLLGQPNDTTPTSSLILQAEKGNNANGAAFTARVSKYAMDFGEPGRVKLVRRVHLHPQADIATPLLVRVGGQMDTGGSTTWSPQRTFTLGTSRYVDIFARGRFISVEIESAGDDPWELPAFDIEYELQGGH